MKRIYFALLFTCLFCSFNAHAGYIEICTEFWEKDWSPQNQGPEVESYTITYSCNTVWEDDSSWLYDSGSSSPAEPEPAPPAPVEEPKKSCGQMILDAEAVGAACKLIESNTANTLANACPDLIYYVEASASLGVSLKKFIDMVFGTTLGVTYNQQCEDRLSFDLGAKLAACEFSVSKMKAAIGPCN